MPEESKVPSQASGDKRQGTCHCPRILYTSAPINWVFSPGSLPVKRRLADCVVTSVAAFELLLLMASLLELSHELLHCILAEIEPTDIASLSKTCRTFHTYITGNRLLYRELYSRRYDEFEPHGCQDSANWEQRVHDVTRMEKLLLTDRRDVKREHLGFVAEQIDWLITTANPDASVSRNVDILTTAFEDRYDNIDVFLCASGLFDSGRAGNGIDQVAADTSELRQASAKLHCLYGVPVDVPPRRSIYSILHPDHDHSSSSLQLHFERSPSFCTRSRTVSKTPITHPWARSKVYDLREYTQKTLWGPFKNDGSQRIDWQKVEAVMIVLGHNLRKFKDKHTPRFAMAWEETFRGATPNSYISANSYRITPPAPPPFDVDCEMYKLHEITPPLDAQDPYGVSGNWMRVVCFLDYNDLYAFNFARPARGIPEGQPRGPIENEEAIRLIRIKLQVTRIDPPDTPSDCDDDDDDAADLDYEEDDGTDANDHLRPPVWSAFRRTRLREPDWSGFRGTRLPIVHFRGTSRSLHASWDPNANSQIRGTVRQTPEGAIRWTTFSIFHGEERWRSEGIQVGGIRSARGVLGNWFDKDYDVHGPAGPTAFWKVSDESGEDDH